MALPGRHVRVVLAGAAVLCLALPALGSAVQWIECTGTNSIQGGSCNDPTEPCVKGSGCTNAGKQASLAACEAECAKTANCSAVTWHDPTIGDGWASVCVLQTAAAWHPSTQGKHFAACNSFPLCACIKPPPPPPPPGPATEAACVVARAAYAKALSALDGRGSHLIYNALNEWIDISSCNVTRPEEEGEGRPHQVAIRAVVGAGTTLFVSPTGSDSNSGTSPSSALQTLHKAQLVLRALTPALRAGSVVNIMAGTYYLGAAASPGSLVFTSADSGAAGAPVTWQAYPATAEVVISGGRKLPCQFSRKGARAQSSGAVTCKLPTDLRFDELFVNSLRQVRARYPNGDPLIPKDGYSTGAKGTATFPRNTTAIPATITILSPEGKAISKVSAFAPDGSVAPAQSVTITDYNAPRGVTTVPNPYAGSRFNSSANHPYWDTTATSQITVPADWKGRNWSSVDGAVVKMYHPAGWGSWAFDVADFNGSTMNFARGGFQEARGGSGAGALYIENLRAELDAPGEYYWDSAAGTLWYIPSNASGLDGADSYLVEVPQIPRVIQFRGTRHVPCSYISLVNVNVSHAAPTYMGSYEAPSGGDWSLHRGGAIFADGAVGIEVDHVRLNQVGGNGVFLSNFVRNSSVTNSDFWRTGDSAVLVVGSTPLGNGTDAASLIPADITVGNNHFDTVGVYMKQTSCIFKGITGPILVRDNVCHSGPRAGFNINDGFMGGAVWQHNVLFSLVRETGDHGTINSWDRKEWFYDCELPSPSAPSAPSKLCFLPKPRTIKGNILIGPAGWNLDFDDATSVVNGENNVIYEGGIKLRDGLFRNMTNNLLLGDAQVWFQVSGFPTDIMVGNYLDRKAPYCGPEEATIHSNVALLLSKDKGETSSEDPHEVQGNTKCDPGIPKTMTYDEVEALARSFAGL